MPTSWRRLTRCDAVCGLSLAGVLAGAACGRATTPQTGARLADNRTSDHEGRRGNRIQHAELLQTNGHTALDALRRARPDLFFARNTTRNAEGSVLPVVYVGSQLHGEIWILEQFITEHIQEIEFIPRREAAFRFGRSHPAGALLVTLRRP